MAHSVHLNLDGAWDADIAGLTTLNATAWGPQLRFSAPTRPVEAFFAELDRQLSPFVVYGSGDFHHLTALWIRRVATPVVVVSFDNHPDWDVRPPWWCCGSWVNRALALSHVQKVSVWGCGRFEAWWPGQAFGNRRAERAGRLEVHSWADGLSLRRQSRRGVIFAATWREQFAKFVKELRGAEVYVTVDLDCLRPEDAVTNWGNGKLSVADLEWALCTLRSGARLIGGDMCGAYSAPVYARRKQRYLSEMDHPKLPAPDSHKTRATNQRTLEQLWPLLTD